MKNQTLIALCAIAFFIFNPKAVAIQSLKPDKSIDIEKIAEKTIESSKTKKSRIFKFKERFSKIGKRIKKRINDVKNSVKKWKRLWIGSFLGGLVGMILSIWGFLVYFNIISIISLSLSALSLFFSVIALLTWLDKKGVLKFSTKSWKRFWMHTLAGFAALQVLGFLSQGIAVMTSIVSTLLAFSSICLLFSIIGFFVWLIKVSSKEKLPETEKTN